MKKKALITTAAAVALVAIVGVGSTLAYFTDQDDVLNTVTFGHVDIDLDEPNFDTEDGDEDNTIENIVPGMEIVKDPTITVLAGSEALYLRAMIEIADESEILTDEMKAELEENIAIGEDWIKSTDGYYYYQARVDKADVDQEVVFFDTVTIPETWGNEVADLTFTINVTAEAIQADSFTPATVGNDIVEWTYKDGTAITAENYQDER
ncbi:MAG: SipW-dependent-type signal peptide-containing protein [Lachnospiraceae bacterium]|nr:SipW-dependent-type signal peptide-containing protein [Lachnospiraceae bacterium]